MTSIVDIEGIGPAIAGKLQKAGIRSTQALLDVAELQRVARR